MNEQLSQRRQQLVHIPFHRKKDSVLCYHQTDPLDHRISVANMSAVKCLSAALSSSQKHPLAQCHGPARDAQTTHLQHTGVVEKLTMRHRARHVLPCSCKHLLLTWALRAVTVTWRSPTPADSTCTHKKHFQYSFYKFDEQNKIEQQKHLLSPQLHLYEYFGSIMKKFS